TSTAAAAARDPMTHILIVYGTTDGHTARIAHVLAEDLRALRCCVDLVDAAGTMRGPSPEGYDGVIVAASVHIGDYQRAVMRWVRLRRSCKSVWPHSRPLPAGRGQRSFGPPCL